MEDAEVFTFPLTCLKTAARYLKREGVKVVVAFEFSGALLVRLLSQGVKAISVDKRAPDHDGPSFQGDFADLLGLQAWDMAFFVGPPCYQHMRHDKCLAAKIKDGRAYWAGALNWRCLTWPNIKSVVVESPDVISHDMFDATTLPGVTMQRFRSSWLGDTRDKFVTLVLKNVDLGPTPTEAGALGVELERRPSHREYDGDDSRDRARSTWLTMPKLADYVATARIKDDGGSPEIDYACDVMRHVLAKWRQKGYPVPPHPANATGRPLEPEARAYQEVRGLGDGRRLVPGRVTFEMPRVAEKGDGQVASNVTANFIKLADRLTERGRQLDEDQQRRWLVIEAMERPVTDSLYFWEAESIAGAKACCSNYYLAPFTDDKVTGGPFDTVEQYFQFMKSAHAGDMATAALIRVEAVPGRCRYLGRKVSHFDAQDWAIVARQVAERAIYLKFTQHPELKAFLAETDNAELVEASPTDAIWGIGIGEADAPTVPRSTWGTNWLGHALMRVRARLTLELEPPMPAALRLALSNNDLWQEGYQLRRGDMHRAGAQPSSSPRHAGPPSPWSVRQVKLSDMEVIQQKLGPDYEVLERGGEGRCFPNSLGEGLVRIGLEEGTDDPDVAGSAVRRKAVAHGAKLLAQDAVWVAGDGEGDAFTVRHLLEGAIASWPRSAKAQERAAGRSLDAENWLRVMAHPNAWADYALLCLAADCYQITIRYHAAENGTFRYTCDLTPRAARPSQATVEVALSVGLHYRAVVPVRTGRGPSSNAVRAPEGVGVMTRTMGRLMAPTESQMARVLEDSTWMAQQQELVGKRAREAEVRAVSQMASILEDSERAASRDQLAGECARESERRETADAVEESRITHQIQHVLAEHRDRKEAEDLDRAIALSLSEKREPQSVDAATPGTSDGEGSQSGGDSEFGDFYGGEPSSDEFGAFNEGAVELTDGHDPLRGGDGEQQVELDALTVVAAPQAPDSVVVMPYRIAEGEQVVLMPPTGRELFGFAANDGSVVDQAEKLVRDGLPDARQAVGFTSGVGEGHTRLVTVATDAGRDVAVARTPRQRNHLIAAGAMAVWCTLAALGAVTEQAPLARLAITAASHFLMHDGSTSALLQAEPSLREAEGLGAGRVDYRAPLRATLTDHAGLTPRDLMERSTRGLNELKQACLAAGGDCVKWADAVKPLALSELSPEQLDEPLPILDPELGRQLFSAPLPVYETPWLDRAPPQVWVPEPSCHDFVAMNAYELLDEGAQRQVSHWCQEATADAQCLEAYGEQCDRKRKPPTIGIGQDQYHPCARGYVWDCRTPPCRLLDYNQPVSTDWDIGYLRKRFKGYPDQRLASNAVEGIRLESDLDLTLTLNSQLVSIGVGYDSVQKTVRELQGRGFYDFFANLPFMPAVVVGQGSRIKSVGSQKYRRTSNFSAPHKVILDGKGRRVVPINEASRCYLIPEWMAKAKDARLRKWAVDKYAHVPTAADGSQQSVHYKFPKEKKPALASATGPSLMRDVSILLLAAHVLAQPLFIWVEDAAFFFNQFGYAPEELWKSTLVVNARPEDLTRDGAKFAPGQLIFVSEKRLGFGSFASSNLAQRFSNALVGWTLEEFDMLEEQARQAHPDPAWEQWLAMRDGLEQQCRASRPKAPREALSDCTQSRLAVLYMYTDDPVGVVVGVDRAIRMLQAWRIVTAGVNLEMAGADKRQLGGDVIWIGILVVAALGLVAVPKNKLLRAKEAVQRTLDRQITFGEYRALVGLLEHMRFIAQLQADATNVLYRPHGRDGESRDGPSALVKPTGLMEAALRKWLAVIAQCAGAVVTIVFHDTVSERISRAGAVYSASSDAAGDGRGTPGIGGYVHGYFWRVALPLSVLRLMHITAWETLAACVNVLVAARLAGQEALLAVQVDAALAPYALSNQRSRSVNVQFMIAWMLSCASYAQGIARRLVVRHLSGDGNVPADLTSRGLWSELAELADLLRVKLVAVTLADVERQLIEATLRHAATQADDHDWVAELPTLFDPPASLDKPGGAEGDAGDDSLGGLLVAPQAPSDGKRPRGREATGDHFTRSVAQKAKDSHVSLDANAVEHGASVPGVFRSPFSQAAPSSEATLLRLRGRGDYVDVDEATGDARTPWSSEQLLTKKQRVYKRGTGGVRQRRHEDAGRGWQVVTTSSFDEGEIVLGMRAPCFANSEAAWNAARREPGWPFDAALIRGGYWYDESMPSLRGHRPEGQAGESDEEGEVNFTWRTRTTGTLSRPPPDMPDWYLVDHDADDPTLVCPPKTIKQWVDWGDGQGDRFTPAPVWRAARHLPPGTVLTFDYLAGSSRREQRREELGREFVDATDRRAAIDPSEQPLAGQQLTQPPAHPPPPSAPPSPPPAHPPPLPAPPPPPGSANAHLSMGAAALALGPAASGVFRSPYSQSILSTLPDELILAMMRHLLDVENGDDGDASAFAMTYRAGRRARLSIPMLVVRFGATGMRHVAAYRSPRYILPCDESAVTIEEVLSTACYRADAPAPGETDVPAPSEMVTAVDGLPGVVTLENDVFDTTWRYSPMEDDADDVNVERGTGHYATVLGAAHYACHEWAHGLMCASDTGEQYTTQVAQSLTFEVHVFAMGEARTFRHARPAYAFDHHDAVTMGTRNMRELDVASWERDETPRRQWVTITSHSTDYHVGIEIQAIFTGQYVHAMPSPMGGGVYERITLARGGVVQVRSAYTMRMQSDARVQALLAPGAMTAATNRRFWTRDEELQAWGHLNYQWNGPQTNLASQQANFEARCALEGTDAALAEAGIPQFAAPSMALPARNPDLWMGHLTWPNGSNSEVTPLTAAEQARADDDIGYLLDELPHDLLPPRHPESTVCCGEAVVQCPTCTGAVCRNCLAPVTTHPTRARCDDGPQCARAQAAELAAHVRALARLRQVMVEGIGARPTGFVSARMTGKPMTRAKKTVKGITYAAGHPRHGQPQFDAPTVEALSPMVIKMIAFTRSQGILNLNDEASRHPDRLAAFREVRRIAYTTMELDGFDYASITPEKLVVMGTYLARLHSHLPPLEPAPSGGVATLGAHAAPPASATHDHGGQSSVQGTAAHGGRMGHAHGGQHVAVGPPWATVTLLLGMATQGAAMRPPLRVPFPSTAAAFRSSSHAPIRGVGSDVPLPQEVIELTPFVPTWARQREREVSDSARSVSSTPPPLDGPRFVPSWARQSAPPPYQPPPSARPSDYSARPPTAPFVPTWATQQSRPDGAQYRAAAPRPGPMRRRDIRRAQKVVTPPPRDEHGGGHRPSAHPYLQPAYGESKLRSDQVAHAEQLATRLASDRSTGRIDAPYDQLLSMTMAVAEARADGINPRTASKDAFAMREFEEFARLRGFDPNLQSRWTREFPERESLKLASFLLFRAQRAVPRSKRDMVAKPMSIFQNHLALCRVFKSRDVELPPPGTVRQTLRGLLRRFIRRFGIESLRPKRVEPVTPTIVQKAVDLAMAGTAVVGRNAWKLSNWTCFIVTSWMVVNLSVGSRKGESTKLPGDVDDNDWFNRAAVTYEIGGRTRTDPTEAELRQMQEGDHALLAPKGSKCDTWGTCHGTEPIILPFHDEPLNAAKWLRDIDLRWPAHGGDRRTLPLFADAQGQPFNDAAFASLIMGVLRVVVGEARAKLLSPHSWRVWLASSLRMCGATDARIQAMGRWLNPESIKIYARMTKQEYALWVDKLMGVKRIDTARTTNLPLMDMADAIAAWGDKLDVDAGMTEWHAPAPAASEPGKALPKGTRISVYWTEMQEWFSGTCTSSRLEPADGGGTQRSTYVAYDAVGPWASCSAAELRYCHCLDDERWHYA